MCLGGGDDGAESLHLEGAQCEGQAPVVLGPGLPPDLALPVHPDSSPQPPLAHILLVGVPLGVLHAVQALVLLEVCSGIFGALKKYTFKFKQGIYYSWLTKYALEYALRTNASRNMFDKVCSQNNLQNACFKNDLHMNEILMK